MTHEVEKLLDDKHTEVAYDPKEGKIICNFDDGTKKHIDPFHLRSKCMCAACVDEIDGR